MASMNMLGVPDPLRHAGHCLGTLAPASSPPTLGAREILEALLNPIWPPNRHGGTVFDLVKPGESVCFVISDHTRKTATDLVLPAIVSGLADAGCSVSDFSILIASGIHRHPTAPELEKILGRSMLDAFCGRIFFHDPDDEATLAEAGRTSRGALVKVNRRVLETDRLIPIGAASYHYHAGFGGGRKSLVPGAACRATIALNHSLTLDPKEDRIRDGVGPGLLDGNPVSGEMFEAAALCAPDIIVNTVLSPAGELVGVFSGDLDAAHRAACRRVEAVDRADFDELADVVVASAGSAMNWVQSHKALCNACRALKPDGRVLLVAPCPEGLGDERFRYWLRRPSLREMCAELRSSPEILGQTALSTRTRGRQAILVTSMPEQDRKDLGIPTAQDLGSAADMILALNPHPSYYLMPDAMHVVPFFAEKSLSRSR